MSKPEWSNPLVLFSVVHLVILGITYGTMTTEMKNFNKTLSEVVTELKKTNTIIYSMKEDDIKLKIKQEFMLERLNKIEDIQNKH